MRTPFIAILFLATASVVAQSASPPPTRWSHGPSTDPNYFPIAVWLQDPSQAARYKAAGINLYVGLWAGPTERQLAALKEAGMQVFCEQNAVGLAHRDDPTIVGWMQPDEPDNAQEVRDPKTGRRSYGPPMKPEKVVTHYQKMHDVDPTRPIMLNLGQWVANREWRGRGNGARPEDYLTYVKGGDIISFDVYPIASFPHPDPENHLWLVPKGVDQLRAWTAGSDKITWNALECTHIGNADRQASPHQVRAEAWMSIIHGTQGIIWFVHQFKPKFDEHALLDDPQMLAAVTALNHQIEGLAAVIHDKAKTDVKVQSSNKDVPIDFLAREHDGATYIFAVGMRNAATKATFTFTGLKPGVSVEVVDEHRTIQASSNTFSDEFNAYDVHLYKIN